MMLPPALRQLLAALGVLVLGFEQLVSSRLPFLAGSDRVLGHIRVLLSVGERIVCWLRPSRRQNVIAKGEDPGTPWLYG
jgi:hypothetical protein